MKPFQSLLLCTGLLSALPAGAADKKEKPRPNIIFILCDDMGYGDLGCYGQKYIQTPNIDEMAREGMRFTQAYAGSPVSAPSRASLMTGQHTGHGHVRGNKEYWPNSPVRMYGNNKDWSVVGQEPYDPDHIILPEVMKKNGYTTGMFGKWAGGYEGSYSTPDKRGVDEFFGFICQFQAHLYYPNFLNRYSVSKGDTGTVRVTLEDNIRYPMFGDDYLKRPQYSADLIHQEALRWLDEQDGNHPFYGLFTYTLPHAELNQPNDSILKHYKKQFFTDKTWGGSEASRYNPSDHTHAQFAGMITRLDAYVGEILAKLKEKGLDKNTLVIFTSDNGPHEEGGADPTFFGRDGKLRGLKRQCLEGGIRIPFIAYWPGHVPAGTVNDHQLAFYDVMPTFCELVGDKNFPQKYLSKKNKADCFDGISFLPTLLGDSARQQEHEFLYWEFHETDQMAVRKGDWKLLVKKGKTSLYNLATDLHEDHDVAAQHPDIVKELVGILLREHTPSPLFKVTLPQPEPEAAIVPRPAHLRMQGGRLELDKTLLARVAAYPGDSIRWVLDGFKEDWKEATGIDIQPTRSESKAGMVLKRNDELAAEAYKLNVDDRQITIEASRPAGFYYALQTLKQLLPRDAKTTTGSNGKLLLPTVEIADAPRFGWRGFMLDEGRHFFGKEEVKRVIDMMARYKMNRFHWHLTEDQGWRIEIKKYPRLTETGAWRDSQVLAYGKVKPDGKRYGGFYTQEDIREVVAYARKKFIEIIPEIDIPGHSQAAIAAYPELLACDPQNPHEVWLHQGVSKDVINVAKPEAVQFAKEVIDELTALFPFGYLHLGGDECPVDKWKSNAECQALLKEIGSTDYRDLQLHFYRQLKDYIASKPAAQQRRLVFWNEVLHGNTRLIGNDITIMAWIGAEAAAKQAASKGMDVILSPQVPYYINRKQSALPTEPLSQGNGAETVEAVYNYQPMKGVDAKLRSHYKGVQANFWTEWVADNATLEYLMLPRLAAVAEAAWTPQGQRDYSSFVERIRQDAPLYEHEGWNYGKHIMK